MNKKGKNNKIIVFSIIIAIGLILYFSGILNSLFSILPVGQCNSDSTGRLITNVNLANSIQSSFNSASAWITIDYTGVGNVGKFGFIGSSSGTGRLNQCSVGTSGSTLLMGNLDNKGYDVYFYMPTTSQKEIEICSLDGKYAYKFRENYGSASNAVDSCESKCVPDCNNKCGGVSDGCGGTCNAICCTPNWNCGNWSTCTSGSQSRSCLDTNNCGQTNPNPLIQSCTVACNPNWNCGSWSPCTNSLQSRTCTDLNSCNQQNPNPLIQSCTLSCTPNWQCSSWSTCTNSLQSRTCSDLNSCGIANPNSLSQSCTMQTNPIVPTLDLGIFTKEIINLGGVSIQVWHIISIAIILSLTLL